MTETKLYKHQTDGGAIYLCTTAVTGTIEGDLTTAIVRLDGNPVLLADTGANSATGTTGTTNKNKLQLNAINAKNEITRELRDNQTDPYHCIVDKNTILVLLQQIETCIDPESTLTVLDIINSDVEL
jgi:hypothetical protein